MILRVLSAALLAGFLAAVVATGLELALTSPLILQAETFEDAADPQAALCVPGVQTPVPSRAALSRSTATGPAIVPVHGPHEGHGAAPAEPGAEAAWQPAPGLARAAFTGLATLIGGVGYALLLGAVLLALGREPSPARGLAFGIAGFAAVALAPAIGLPPELPGMPSAALGLRQTWWLMTVGASLVGLYLIAVRRVPLTIAGGVVLVVAPHLVGAPLVADAASRLPPALAAQFAARSLAVAFVFWAVLGLAYGWAWNLFGARAAVRSGAPRV